MSSRIIFVNRFYWPEEPATAQLLTDLAEGLAATGHQVSVVASRPARHAAPATETRRGVFIRRLAGSRLGERSLVGRVFDFLTFMCAALAWLVGRTGRGETVVFLTDPPLLAALGAPLVRWRGARVVHWVQDIYPEIAVELTGKRWPAFLKPFRDRAWRGADACVTLGTDMAAMLRSRGVLPSRIRIVPNWAPVGLRPEPPTIADDLRRAWHLENMFVVLYSGNLGRVHDLEPILEAAEALRESSDIVFVFIGGGAQRENLQHLARARGLTHVHFHPSQPRADLVRSLALGDAHLVTLREGCEQLVFPSKFYGICAIGRPVLFVGPHGCELSGLIINQELGESFTRKEMPKLAQAVQALSRDHQRRRRLGLNARRYVETNASQAGALANWTELLASLSASEKSPGLSE